VQDHWIEFAEYTSAPQPRTVSVAHSPAVGERDVPALLTMLRWTPDASTDAVLLTPGEVRHAWQEFTTVRSSPWRACAASSRHASQTLCIPPATCWRACASTADAPPGAFSCSKRA
jgi:hypothetical protein